MSLVFRRSSAAPASVSASWQDVTVGFSSMTAQLATDGRKVRCDLTGSDWGAHYDDLNGASVTRVVGGAYDGTDCVRIVPPISSLPNGNKTTYSSILRGLRVDNGGTKDVARAALGFCVKYGPTYFSNGETAKVTGFLSSQTLGGATSASTRLAIYEDYRDGGASDFRRVFFALFGGIGEFYDPPQGGYQGDHPDSGLLMLLGSSINHANDPPLVGSEWLYFLQRIDVRQDGVNAFGRQRIDVWAESTGYLGKIDAPLTTRSDWDFSYQHIQEIEYVGGLWNDPTPIPDAGVHLDVSHPIVAVNLPWDHTVGSGVIGPPWG